MFNYLYEIASKLMAIGIGLFMMVMASMVIIGTAIIVTEKFIHWYRERKKDVP